MIFLRMFSFLAGSFVLFGSPFLLLSAHQQSGPGATVILAVLTLLLFAGVYFYFSLFGHRSGRSPRLRYLGAGMIAFQLLAGSWLLTTSHNATALVASAPLLCFTVFLFLAFVWPGESGRTHRPMRRRDPAHS